MGSNQTVQTGATVTLDGTGSSDPGGESLTYQWTQTGGTRGDVVEQHGGAADVHGSVECGDVDVPAGGQQRHGQQHPGQCHHHRGEQPSRRWLMRGRPDGADGCDGYAERFREQ